MKAHPKQGPESEARGDLVSRLSAATLRISASLELDTVLREVLDSARALTGARCGVITTVDEAGQAQDFVSSGISPEEHRQLAEWPGGPRLFEHLRSLPGALRLTDLNAYVRSLGFSSMPALTRTFQGTPMRHRDVDVGSFFLGEKEGGGEFTGEDEEILMLFASQAATAIANARAYRNEQRARADLEALVDTSPVGVVVFNARAGRMVSVNREAKRIVEGLRLPGGSLEQVLEVLTLRRADGQEVSLEKLSMTQALGTGETVRAEEIVLEVPDGRRLRTLINATPIQSGDGEVESVVVTLQDLTPLEELERLRSEFLDMVSHELRAPLTSIKGSTATVLGASPAPPPAEVLQFFRIIDEQADHMRGLISDLLDAGSIEAGTLSVTPEPSDLADLVDQARTTFLSGGRRHTVLLDLPPDLPRVMGRPAAHRPGPEQPAGQRRPALARVVDHSGRRGAPWRRRRDLRGRRRPGCARREAALPLSEVHGPWRGGPRTPGHGAGAGHLQGPRGGPRGAHPGRQWGARPGRPSHVLGSGGRGGRRRRRGREHPAPGSSRRRADPHPGGGRRPAGPAFHARHSRGSGLRPDRDRGPSRPDAHPARRETPVGPARLAAARDRRHRTDGKRPPDWRTGR